MSTTQVNIVPSKHLENTRTTQYTSGSVQGSTVRTLLDKCTVINTSTVAATFSLNLVNASSTVGDSNLLVDERRVEPGEVYDCPEVIGQILQEGQAISTIASAANALSLRISGREVVT